MAHIPNPSGKGGFKPGESGNPKGRLPMSPELRAIKALSPGYVKKIISKLTQMDPKTLMAWVELSVAGQTVEPMNNLEMMLASIINKAVSEGDQGKLNFLLDRTIGKVVENRNVTLQPVKYITTVREDGALMQEVIAESLGETDDGGE